MSAELEAEMRQAYAAWEMLRTTVANGNANVMFNEYDMMVYLQNVDGNRDPEPIPVSYPEHVDEPTYIDKREPEYAVRVNPEHAHALDALFYETFPRQHQHVLMQIRTIVDRMGKLGIDLEDDEPRPGFLILTKPQLEWVRAFCHRISNAAAQQDYDAASHLVDSIKQVLDGERREAVDEEMKLYVMVESFAPAKEHRNAFITVSNAKWSLEAMTTPEIDAYQNSCVDRGKHSRLEIDMEQEMFQRVMGFDHTDTLMLEVRINYETRRLELTGHVRYAFRDDYPPGDVYGVDAEYTEQVLANIGAVDRE